AILDVGCGASYLPLLLSTFGHSVTALDSHNMDFGFPQYKFVQADALTAEFEHTFDYIIMLSSLEHIGVMDEKDPYKDIKTIEN
ncbi:MAG: methyltransferase domain-containing protein, partial [Aliifodinibius sp.]|nr:methyltransferase domain-containing protein [Fodinibius sp.]